MIINTSDSHLYCNPWLSDLLSLTLSNPMRKTSHLLTFLTLALAFTSATAIGQKKNLINFINEYDALRYSLHPEMNETSFMQIDPATTSRIKTFLKENKSRIIDYRNHVLERFVRDDVEKDQSAQFTEDEELRQTLQSSHIFMSMFDKFEAIGNSDLQPSDLMEFLSVDPMLLLHSISSQVQSSVLMDKNQDTKEIATLYARSFIGGRYITSTKIDKTNWSVRIFEYHYYTQFAVNTESGRISLEKIYRRKG